MPTNKTKADTKNPNPTPSGGGSVFIRASFVHWRSKKRIFAKDHGHRGFPMRGKKK